MEVSYGYCGIFCMGATAKVKLANKIPGYPYLYVYLVVPCLETVLEDSSIQVRATKLFVKEKACYYNSIINTIDSKGVPFYKLNEKEAGKLKQRAHINGTLKPPSYDLALIKSWTVTIYPNCQLFGELIHKQ